MSRLFLGKMTCTIRMSINVTPQVERDINNKETLFQTLLVFVYLYSLFLALIKCFAGSQKESKCLLERQKLYTVRYFRVSEKTSPVELEG